MKKPYPYVVYAVYSRTDCWVDFLDSLWPTRQLAKQRAAQIKGGSYTCQVLVETTPRDIKPTRKEN